MVDSSEGEIFKKKQTNRNETNVQVVTTRNIEVNRDCHWELTFALHCDGKTLSETRGE